VRRRRRLRPGADLRPRRRDHPPATASVAGRPRRSARRGGGRPGRPPRQRRPLRPLRTGRDDLRQHRDVAGRVWPLGPRRPECARLATRPGRIHAHQLGRLLRPLPPHAASRCDPRPPPAHPVRRHSRPCLGQPRQAPDHGRRRGPGLLPLCQRRQRGRSLGRILGRRTPRVQPRPGRAGRRHGRLRSGFRGQPGQCCGLVQRRRGPARRRRPGAGLGRRRHVAGRSPGPAPPLHARRRL